MPVAFSRQCDTLELLLQHCKSIALGHFKLKFKYNPAKRFPLLGDALYGYGFNITTSPDDTTRLTTKFNVTLSTKNKNKKLIYTYDPIVLTLESTNHIGLANGEFQRFTSAPNNVTIIHSTLSIVSQVLDVDSVSTLKSDLKRKSGLPVRILLDTKVAVQMDKLKSNKVGIRVTCDGINGPIPKGENPTVASIATAKCKVDLRKMQLNDSQYLWHCTLKVFDDMPDTTNNIFFPDFSEHSDILCNHSEGTSS
ncbi:hypothetical protein RND71_006223 [Anisodus tanguticus]|uniref:Uncharacterized protein n=1 Tax=Anisodus tanguticus TaxID=243964 RepID=A0AAE1SVP4_9SOLA|nr:hypothetical protein RND71_006223 [Anisodus tanguticus]